MHSGIQTQNAFPSTAAQKIPSRRKPHPAPQTARARLTEISEPLALELVNAGAVLLDLAESHKGSKDRGLAEVCYLRALDVFSKALPSNHPTIAATRDNLASLYRERGQLSVAESLQRTAIADLRSHFRNAPNEQLATALRNLAETCLLGGKIQEGLKILSEAVQMTKQLSNPSSESHVVEINRYHAQVIAGLG